MPEPTRNPHAHLVQLNIAWEDPAANHERVWQLLDRADVAPGDLILLPEMFATGFSFNIQATNDKSGATLTFLSELSQDLRTTVMGGRTLAPCHQCAAKNVMTVLAPTSGEPRLLAEYTKVHPFQREAERFEPGREVLTFNWPEAGLNICPAICYDLRFPELFRAGLTKGAQLFALGACWPSVRQSHWRALAIARAIENQAFVLACNRTGDDPGMPRSGGLHYAGGTIAISPTGDVIGELGDQEAVLSVPIDVAQLHDWRARFSAWKDACLLNACQPNATHPSASQLNPPRN